jgi:hypothetical protein
MRRLSPSERFTFVTLPSTRMRQGTSALLIILFIRFHIQLYIRGLLIRA